MENPTDYLLNNSNSCSACCTSIQLDSNHTPNTAELESAMCTFFLDVYKYLNEIEKHIYNANLSSLKEPTESGKSAKLLEHFSTKHPHLSESEQFKIYELIDEKFDEFDSTDVDGKIAYLTKVFKSLKPSNGEKSDNVELDNDWSQINKLPRIHLNLFALDNFYYKSYSEQLDHFDGSDEDFFIANGLEIFKDSSHLEFFCRFDYELDLAYLKDLYQKINCIFDVEFDWVQDLKENPFGLDLNHEVYISKFNGLLTSIREKKIKTLGSLPNIFSLSPLDSSFYEDIKDLKEYFISTMQDKGELPVNFSFRFEPHGSYSTLETPEREQYQELLYLMEKHAPLMHILLIDRERERHLSYLKATGESPEKLFKESIHRAVETYVEFNNCDDLEIINFSTGNPTSDKYFYLMYADAKDLIALFYNDEYETQQKSVLAFHDFQNIEDAEETYLKLAEYSAVQQLAYSAIQQLPAPKKEEIIVEKTEPSIEKESSFFGNWSIFS